MVVYVSSAWSSLVNSRLGTAPKSALFPSDQNYLASKNKAIDAFTCNCGETEPTEDGPHYQMIGVAGVVSRYDHRNRSTLV